MAEVHVKYTPEAEDGGMSLETDYEPVGGGGGGAALRA